MKTYEFDEYEKENWEEDIHLTLPSEEEFLQDFINYKMGYRFQGKVSHEYRGYEHDDVVIFPDGKFMKYCYRLNSDVSSWAFLSDSEMSMIDIFITREKEENDEEI